MSAREPAPRAFPAKPMAGAFAPPDAFAAAIAPSGYVARRRGHAPRAAASFAALVARLVEEGWLARAPDGRPRNATREAIAVHSREAWSLRGALAEPLVTWPAAPDPCGARRRRACEGREGNTDRRSRDTTRGRRSRKGR